MKNLTTIDFETKGIEKLPDYPPKPVGVAIETPRGRREYLAWGHPEGNNCDKADAVRRLRDILRSGPVLYHNSAFDIMVAHERLGLPIPTDFHDTLFLAFLNDPSEDSLSLKPLALKYCKYKATTRDRLKEWILINVLGATEKDWGAHIADAPGDLVGRYAKDDVGMTREVFDEFYPSIIKNGMEEAYKRELALVSHVWEMEKHGVHIALTRLKRETRKWEKEYLALESAVKRRLRVGKDFNINSDKQLADALEARGLVNFWYETDKGNRSTAMDNLAECVNDKGLVKLLRRRSKFDKILSTYAHPWIEMASANNGRIFPRFNQTRSNDERGRNYKGTRTGRFSSDSPNLQNVPGSPKDDRDLDLPNLRDFIIPDPGTVFVDRDYNQQELRILFDYAGGPIKAEYNRNPRLDVHTRAGVLIAEITHMKLARKPVKTIGFGVIYGMGVKGLALKLGVDKKEAKKLYDAYMESVPGVKELIAKLKELAKKDEPLRTWGGRLYWCEEPATIDGRLQTFEYKMLNNLIQPSAADCTKQAFLNIRQSCKARMALTVHDEFLMCAKKGTEKKEMARMREAMEAVKFGVPMLSDGTTSAVSWGRMKKYVDPR